MSSFTPIYPASSSSPVGSIRVAADRPSNDWVASYAGESETFIDTLGMCPNNDVYSFISALVHDGYLYALGEGAMLARCPLTSLGDWEMLKYGNPNYLMRKKVNGQEVSVSDELGAYYPLVNLNGVVGFPVSQRTTIIDGVEVEQIGIYLFDGELEFIDLTGLGSPGSDIYVAYGNGKYVVSIGHEAWYNEDIYDFDGWVSIGTLSSSISVVQFIDGKFRIGGYNGGDYVLNTYTDITGAPDYTAVVTNYPYVLSFDGTILYLVCGDTNVLISDDDGENFDSTGISGMAGVVSIEGVTIAASYAPGESKITTDGGDTWSPIYLQQIEGSITYGNTTDGTLFYILAYNWILTVTDGATVTTYPVVCANYSGLASNSDPIFIKIK